MKYIRGCKINQKECADDFYEAYQRCLEGKNPVVDGNRTIYKIVAIPAFVNGFFACELYFKYLIGDKLIEKTGHNLKRLYNKLDNSYKDKLKKLDDKSYKIEELLKEIGNGFKNWRYIYEDGNEDFGHDYPFLYSEKFLEIYLPIIKQLADEKYGKITK